VNDGFSLVELLIATAIVVALTGIVVGMLNPVHGMHQAQIEVADLHQRLRVAVESLRRDVIAAGAGSLADALAPVMPYRAGDVANDATNGLFYRVGAITAIHVPSRTAQARVQEATPLGATELLVNARFNCGALEHTALCGFTAGMHVVIFDASGAWDLMTVERVESPVLYLQHRRARSPNRYGADAVIAEVAIDIYHLEIDERARSYELRHGDGFDADFPLLDDVVEVEFEYYGDPQPPRRLDDGATYGPTPPLSGENCTFAIVDGEHVPRLPVLAAGAEPVLLTPAMLQDGPWCPNDISPDRFDADLLRIRRVRVRMRLQTGDETLRGPAGALFKYRGTASSGYRLVPDQLIAFDITPRNLAVR